MNAPWVALSPRLDAASGKRPQGAVFDRPPGTPTNLPTSRDSVSWLPGWSVRSRAVRFGAFYPTYGAMPVHGGTLFVYPGEQDGGKSIQGMAIMPMARRQVKPAQRWKDLQPWILKEGFRWWLQRCQLPQAQAEDPQATQKFWERVEATAKQKGRPDAWLLQKFSRFGECTPDEGNQVLFWTLSQWRETLREHLTDPLREPPYLPFVPLNLQVDGPSTAGSSLENADTSAAKISAEKIRMEELSQSRIVELQRQWADQAEVRAKLSHVRAGDFFAFVPMEAANAGDSQTEGLRYLVELRKKGQVAPELRPDPWAAWQPQDVHGPSQAKNLNYDWSPAATAFWNQPKHQGRLALQQVHIGTFTQEGTYAAALKKLQAQKAAAENRGEAFGFTGIELNPLGEFPGFWNWGYDGTYYFAPENGYGLIQDLQALVNWCHENDVAVVFDLVLNHFGPEGNYLGDYGGRLFDSRGGNGLGGSLDWGNPLAMAQAKQAVRYWVENFRADGIRFDLSQAMPDYAMQEISKDIRRFKPNIFLIYEDYRADDRVTQPPNAGLGANLQYNSDGWHAWKDFLEAQARHGESKLDHFYAQLWQGLQGARRPLEAAFNYLINHDILGNDWRQRLVKVMNDWAGSARGTDLARMATVLHPLLPGTPLSFQGEDEGRVQPLNFFTSFLHLETNLGVLVGRGKEYKPEFEPGRPGSTGPASFRQSNLNQSESEVQPAFRTLAHAALRLRQQVPAFWQGGREALSFDRFYPRTEEGSRLMREHRASNLMLFHRTGRTPSGTGPSGWQGQLFTPDSEAFVMANFSDQDRSDVTVPFPGGRSEDWQEALNTDRPELGGADRLKGGPSITQQGALARVALPARSVVVFTKGPDSKAMHGATLTTREQPGGDFKALPALSETARNSLASQFVLA